MNDLISVTSKKAEETRNIAVAFIDSLGADELLTGTATATEIGSSELAIADAALTTIDMHIHNRLVKPQQAVMFSVSGGAKRSTYSIKVLVGTTSSPAQTLVKVFQLQIV